MGTFTTNIKLGAIGYVVKCNYNDYTFYVKEMEVGKVEIEQYHPKANRYDNHIYVEKYMCFDTGVGSGTVYTYGENIFNTRSDAENIGIVKHKQRHYKQIAAQEKRKAELDAYKRERDLRMLNELKAKYENTSEVTC